MTPIIHIADEKERKAFESAVRGLSVEAITRLCELQPGVAKPPELHPLGILSRLENLDKHRNLIRLAFILSEAKSTVFRSGALVGGQAPGFREDGTVVARFGFSPPRLIPEETEVKVKITGTPQIVVQGAVKDRYGDLPQLLRILVEDIPEHVIPVLEPFVRP
jgi:hypothetical protein